MNSIGDNPNDFKYINKYIMKNYISIEDSNRILNLLSDEI